MTIRPLTEHDAPLINDWIARDPEHRALGMTAEFFAGMLSFAIEDALGPVMFVGLEGAGTVRIHIQFEAGQERRTAGALLSAFPSVRDTLKKLHCTQMIFESVSRPLITFCKRRLGFRRIHSSNDYSLNI